MLVLSGQCLPCKSERHFYRFQLNLWHGCTKVPNGDQGIIDVLDQMDADVVFLCEIRDGKQFIPHVIEELEKRGKHYYGETFDLAIGVLSKFKPDSWTKCCIVPGDEGRAMVKMLQQSKANPYLSILVIWTTGIINAICHVDIMVLPGRKWISR